MFLRSHNRITDSKEHVYYSVGENTVWDPAKWCRSSKARGAKRWKSSMSNSRVIRVELVYGRPPRTQTETMDSVQAKLGR